MTVTLIGLIRIVSKTEKIESKKISILKVACDLITIRIVKIINCRILVFKCK